MTGMQIPINAGRELLPFFWPQFEVKTRCVYRAALTSTKTEFPGTATDWESFVNHTHILDQFGSHAVRETREEVSEQPDVVECIYDQNHPDFIAACELGRAIAQMWATKLKLDFPNERFRVYYTQYDNPIVRFHKVRSGEPVWLDDESLRTAEGADFRAAVVYDTEHLDRPVWNRRSL